MARSSSKTIRIRIWTKDFIKWFLRDRTKYDIKVRRPNDIHDEMEKIPARICTFLMMIMHLFRPDEI